MSTLKILFLTDTHIRGTNPKNRTDDFVHTLENKLNEIVDIIDKENIDYIIHGGDLFDRPDISISVVSRFAKIFKKIEIPLYIVSGNHDTFGQNPNTINRTVLGLFGELDFINILDNKKAFFKDENTKVQVTGQPYIYDIDTNINKHRYILEDVDEDADYSLHVVHGMLLDKPFIKGIPYTLVEDIKDTKADITLSGHYHSGFDTISIDDKHFVNPGSLVRITNSLKEIERRPKVAIIELKGKISIEYRYLNSALDGKQILDRSEIEKHVYKTERLFEFKQTIDSALEFDKMDINDILIEVSMSEGVEDEVKEEALRRIAQVQMKDL